MFNGAHCQLAAVHREKQGTGSVRWTHKSERKPASYLLAAGCEPEPLCRWGSIQLLNFNNTILQSGGDENSHTRLRAARANAGEEQLPSMVRVMGTGA